jgi:hypothetical protein
MAAPFCTRLDVPSTLYYIAASGIRHETLRAGQFLTPWGLAVDDSGYVYVAGTNNGFNRKFTLSPWAARSARAALTLTHPRGRATSR